MREKGDPLQIQDLVEKKVSAPVNKNKRHDVAWMLNSFKSYISNISEKL